MNIFYYFLYIMIQNLGALLRAKKKKKKKFESLIIDFVINYEKSCIMQCSF